MVHNWPPLAGNNKVRLVQQSVKERLRSQVKRCVVAFSHHPGSLETKVRALPGVQGPGQPRLHIKILTQKDWSILNPCWAPRITQHWRRGREGCKSKTSLGYAVRPRLKTPVSASLLCVGVISGSTESSAPYSQRVKHSTASKNACDTWRARQAVFPRGGDCEGLREGADRHLGTVVTDRAGSPFSAS